MEIEGTYRLRDPGDADVCAPEILVLEYHVCPYNGIGVHYREAGETEGYGWMRLDYLRAMYEPVQVPA